MTHADLVERGRLWLARRCAVVATELGCVGAESPDVVGWNSNGVATLIECKRTRSDFLADRKKIFRHYMSEGLAEFRYYLTTGQSVITPADLPEHWGLLYVRGSRLITVKQAVVQESNARSEKALLVSMLRRIAVASDEQRGLCVRFYTYETKRKASVGVGL